jgi:hypothetical protein
MIVEIKTGAHRWKEMELWLLENMPNRWSCSEPIGSIIRDVEFYNERDCTLFMLRWGSK